MRKYFVRLIQNQLPDYSRLWIVELSLCLQNLRSSLALKVCHHITRLHFHPQMSLNFRSNHIFLASSLTETLFSFPWCALYCSQWRSASITGVFQYSFCWFWRQRYMVDYLFKRLECLDCMMGNQLRPQALTRTRFGSPRTVPRLPTPRSAKT